ncbi:MAG: ribonuclease III [SAR324 cluster bacterium]|nr:ribonuclease III [SAR324 cluster bacterium]
MKDNNIYQDLQKKIGYSFTNKQLLKQALTHASVNATKEDNEKTNDDNYEKLELLGDAVLQLVVTKLLVERYPQQTEGMLSKIRSMIVCKKNLHQSALKLNLQNLVELGSSMDSQRENLPPKILSDLVESLIGAIYLDNKDTTKSLLSIKKFIDLFMWQSIDNLKDQFSAKALLNETLHKINRQANYSSKKVIGADNSELFQVELLVSGQKISFAHAKSKKEAEELAAASALAKLEKDLLDKPTKPSAS